MTNAQIPFWYKLILGLKSRGKIATGLTLPYIIGAYKLIGNYEELEDLSIEALLKDIAKNNTLRIPFIQMCPVINQYVVGIESRSYEKYFIHINDLGILFLGNNAETLGATFNEICTNLKLKHDTHINNENFSWDKDKETWRNFDHKDIDNIASIN
ncbi:hypothetical protein GCM10027299_52460 [Larkinella ripae]